MEEISKPDSVSMPASPRASKTKPRRSASEPRSWLPQPVYLAVALLLVVSIGWGAFHVLGRSTPSDDDAELADLDGFDEQSPGLDSPEALTEPASDTTLNPPDQSAQPWQSAAAAPSSFHGPRTAFVASNQQALRFDRASSDANANQQTVSGAWLIGTIEADDAPERIALPPRVSQTAADGPVFPSLIR